MLGAILSFHGGNDQVNSSGWRVLMMWEDFLNHQGWEGGGGPLWNYFFYSLLLGDNINWGGGPQFCESRVSFDEGHFIQKWYAMGKSRTYPKEIASYHTRWYILTYTYLYFQLRGSVQLEWILEMSKQAKISQFQAKLWTEMLAPIDGAVGHDIGIYVIDAICSLILHRQFKIT